MLKIIASAAAQPAAADDAAVNAERLRTLSALQSVGLWPPPGEKR